MKDGHALRTDIAGDGNIGLFCVATEKFCLAPRTVTEKQASEIENVLGVSVHKISVGSTNFLGAFIAANKSGVVVPDMIEDDEKKTLERGLGVEVCVLESRFNTLGNLIAANDRGVVVSSLFNEKQKKTIEHCLGVEAVTASVAKTPLVGSGCLSNNSGALLHRDVKDGEREMIEAALKVKAVPSTLGFGSPWVGATAVCNSRGLVAGKITTIHEIVRADGALGFV